MMSRKRQHRAGPTPASLTSRWSGILLLFAAVAVIAGCGSEGETTATVWPAGEPAWVIQGEDGRAVIQVVAADGSTPRAVAPDAQGGEQTNPDWSPDGGRVTFVMTGGGGKDDLWVVDVDGTSARQAFDCTDACDYVDDPAWAPDGKTIAVCMLTADGDEHLGTLTAIDVATGTPTTLFTFDDPRDFCAGPRWSPDGTEVVLEVVRRNNTRLNFDVTGVTLAILDLTKPDAEPRPLTDPQLFATTADWSPDGETIVYAALPAADSGYTDLFTIGRDGGDTKRLTTLADDGGAASEPSFDADGRSVVFVPSATSSLMRVNADGGEVDAAFPTDVGGRHPRARPLPG